MSRLIYDLTISGYYLAIRLGTPFSDKVKKLHRGQKNTLDLLRKYFEGNALPVAWFHCASLGEFEQGRPVIEAFKKAYPDHQILLTFFSPSGYEVRKDYPEADLVAYFPKDTQRNAEAFADIVKPSVVFFIKYEFWYHHLSVLIDRNIPLIGVSCIFRPSQIYFNKGNLFLREVIRKFTALFVQNEASYELLLQYRFTNMIRSKDTRFDRVYQICKGHRTLPLISQFKGKSPLLVIGSSWPSDLKVITPVLNKAFPDLKVIIAPHDISEGQIAFIEKSLDQRKTARYSNLWDEKDLSEATDILIIDNIGMLTSLYQYADVAYVGGAFKEGLHNILEPAVFDIPVIFGSTYTKFNEAKELTLLGGAFSIKDKASFESKLHKLLTDQSYREKAGNICGDYIKANVGATDQIMDFVSELLDGRSR